MTSCFLYSNLVISTCAVEPIRPIDPSAWVMQTNQHQADYQAYRRQFAGSPTLSTMTSNSSPSLTSSIPESEREYITPSINQVSNNATFF